MNLGTMEGSDLPLPTSILPTMMNDRNETPGMVVGGKVGGHLLARGKGKGKGKHGGKTGGKVGKKIKISRSSRANLTFPVGRIHSRLKDTLLRKQRCGASAAVYCAALLEYLVSEVIELAGVAARECKTRRIKPRHLLLAIRGDDELNKVVNATISHGGVPENIHVALLKKSKKKQKRAA